jgi:glycosyltransferase involved in cell wall biosynthesis
MKVLLWTDSDCFAGTERHCSDLAAGLQELGVEVSVGCREGSPLAQRVSSAGGAVELLDASRFPMASVGRVQELMRSQAVDVVHAHNGVTAFMSAIARRNAARGALVVSQHFIEPARVARRGIRKAVSSLVHSFTERHVDQWVAVSKAVRDAMLARGDTFPGKVRVVYNGVPAPQPGEPGRRASREMLSIGSEERMLLCVARLEAEKGHVTMLNALSMLQSEGCAFRAVFLGEGALRKELEAQAQALGLSWRVQFMGQQDNPNLWMRAADVLVLSSPLEPFGLVLPEAMSRGVAVVAANAGGPSEIIGCDGGVLFHPNDARDLARKLFELLSRQDYRDEVAESGHERWSNQFDLPAMSRAMAALYLSLL